MHAAATNLPAATSAPNLNANCAVTLPPSSVLARPLATDVIANLQLDQSNSKDLLRNPRRFVELVNLIKY